MMGTPATETLNRVLFLGSPKNEMLTRALGRVRSQLTSEMTYVIAHAPNTHASP
jgi:hypothetical protein